MIGLDTNIVLRLFVDDHNSVAARRFVARNCGTDAPGYVNVVSLCEVVWVLHRVHRYDREAVADILTEVLSSNDIEVQDHDLVRSALAQFKAAKGDFADALIGEINQARGCHQTATFDRKAVRLRTFVSAA